MALLKDLSGQTFNYLYVERISHRHGPRKRAYYLCTCKCGNTTTVEGSNLTTGTVKSCGCKRKEPPPNKTHGKKHHLLYGVWSNMKGRCYNKKDRSYPRYGGRGIVVGPEWLHDFQVFFDWAMENGWEPGLEIDRRDNDLGYSPSNCRVVTRTVNLANKGIYSNNSTGYAGVSAQPGKQGGYLAKVSEYGKLMHVGCFDNIKDAVAARNAYIAEHGLLLKEQTYTEPTTPSMQDMS